MSAFTPGMQSALAADAPIIFGALRIQLPDRVLRLLDGSGNVTFGGETYTGLDATFGTLAAVNEISDGVGDEAPAISLTLVPASSAAAAMLASPAMQGSAVSLWLGAVDRATGAVVPDPLLVFQGVLDQPVLSVEKGVRELELECVSGFERLFDNDEGVRLADSFHKNVWPTEQGLANVSGIIRTIYWGVEAPRGSIFFGGGGGGFGGTFEDRLNIRER